MLTDRAPDVTFDVRGLPVSQGSARAFVRGQRAIVTTVSGPLSAWRNAIATEARDAIGDTPPATGPVIVHLWFRMPRPRSHYLPANGSRPTAELRLDAPDFCPKAPDVDKLSRAALDALTAVVYLDDAQVVRLVAQKRYDDAPGVTVSVWATE